MFLLVYPVNINQLIFRKQEKADKTMKEFLQKHGMAPEGIDLRRETENFLLQMQQGLKKEASSLPMLPVYLSGKSGFRDRRVTVMDAGGTNFRIAVLYFDEQGTCHTERFHKCPMPGTGGAMDKESFFDTLAAFLEQYGAEEGPIGFCFSYATESTRQGDGRILEFSKEVRITGAEGCLLGEEINAALAKRGLPARKIVILNDTVAVMFCGMSRAADAYSDHVGFILGTGMNTCYREDKAFGETVTVNMESGCYSGFPRGDFDRELDEASENPGSHLMEKMVSGGYLGELLSRAMLGAAREGLLSSAGAAAVEELGLRSLAELSAFREGEGELVKLFSQEDRAKLYELMDGIFHRAGRITAVLLAAILLHGGKATDPQRPVCITAEGTTFYKALPLRRYIDLYCQQFIREELGLHFCFSSAEDATLLGSAVAALSAE